MSQEKKVSLDQVLKDAKEPEDQLKIALDFMRAALNQEKSPRLRDFWEAKTACLPLFKQRISPSARSYFWEEFIELSNEARRLKEVLDEQSAFAQEQIDLAIQALESDLDRFDEMLSQMQEFKLSDEAKELLSDAQNYNQLYKELALLTALSSRISGLKQEVVKTSMRVRQKGRIFEKLQELREQILPKRISVIDALSHMFTLDVQAFVKTHKPKPTKPFYALREDIKTLQELSKALNISTEAFSQTREILSRFWDQIRALDKDRKKALGEKKQNQKENAEAAGEKIDALEKELEALSPETKKQRISEMYTTLRSLDLHRDSVQKLKQRLKQLENQPVEQTPKTATSQPEKIDERPMLAQQAFAMVQNASALQILEKIQTLPIESDDPLLDPLHDLYIDKKQQELLEHDEVLVSAVEELIDLRKKQKKRLQKRLETLRKTKGAHSLDFEKAMQIEEDTELKKSFVKTVENAIKELKELIK